MSLSSIEYTLKDLRPARCALALHSIQQARISPAELSILVYELSAISEETLKWREYVVAECKPIQMVILKNSKLLDAAKERRIDDCADLIRQSTHLSELQRQRAEVAFYSSCILQMVEQDKIEEAVAEGGDQYGESYKTALANVMRSLLLLSDPSALKSAMDEAERDLLAALAFWDRTVVFNRAKQLISRAEKFRAEHTDIMPNVTSEYYHGVDAMSIIEVYLYAMKNVPFMDKYELRPNRSQLEILAEKLQFVVQTEDFSLGIQIINKLEDLVPLPMAVREIFAIRSLYSTSSNETPPVDIKVILMDSEQELKDMQTRSDVIVKTPAQLDEESQFLTKRGPGSNEDKGDHTEKGAYVLLWRDLRDLVKPQACVYSFLGRILEHAAAMEAYEAPYYTSTDQFTWLSALPNNQNNLPRKLDHKLKVGDPKDPFDRSEAWDLSFSPFGDMLAINSSSGNVVIVDPYSGKIVFRLPALAEDNVKYYPKNELTKKAETTAADYRANKDPDTMAHISELIRRIRRSSDPDEISSLRRKIHSCTFNTVFDHWEVKDGNIGDNYMRTDVVLDPSGNPRLSDYEDSDEEMSDFDVEEYDHDLAFDYFSDPKSEKVMRYWIDCLTYMPGHVQGYPAALALVANMDFRPWDDLAVEECLDDLISKLDYDELDELLRYMHSFKIQDDAAAREAKYSEREERVDGMPTEEEIRRHYAKLEPPIPQGPSVSRGACCLAWSPDGNFLLIGSEDGRVAMWEFFFVQSKLVYAVCKNHQINDGKSHDTRVSAVCWLPLREDNQIWWAAGDLAGNLTMRIVSPDTPNDQIWFSRGKRVLSMAVYARPCYAPKLIVISAEADPKTNHTNWGYVYYFDLPESGFPLERSLTMMGDRAPKQQFCSLTVSQGPSQHLLGNCSPGDVMTFDIKAYYARTAKEVTFQGPVQKTTIVKSCFGGPHQKYIACGSEDGITRVFHRETKAKLLSITHKDADKKTRAVNSVAWAPDCCCLATACDDGYVRILRP